MTVPNSFPSIATNKYRIAVIGEAPGRNEEVMGKPFVGASGKLLKDILGKVGLPSDTLFFGNICQHRPLNDEIENFAWDSYEIQSGLEQLAKDLEAFRPHLCILLGKTALFAATNRSDITNQRGSIFIASQIHTPFTGRKCMATYHPEDILHVYEWRPFLAFDLRRAADEGQSPHWEPPYRDIVICKTTQEVAACLSNVEQAKCGTDIEGYVNDLQCIGIADKPSHAFVIPFKNALGDSFWSFEDERLVWQLLATWLESPLSSKVWQNGLYDRFILQYSYFIIPRNNTDDTMLQWHEKYCELPKSLATMTSVLTAEPFYKQERKSEDKNQATLLRQRCLCNP
jgi:DNA polymerase